MIYTLGESLIDIIFKTTDALVAKPGGSMLNTSVSLGRSGVEVSLISELGDDETANIILEFLKKNNTETEFIKKYYHQNTSVALAFLNDQKVPSFSIYKSYPEKRRLIFPAEFTDADILVYGSLYSLDPAIRNDVVHILAAAKRGGAVLCYDPNIRHHNLKDSKIRQALEENINFANIVKGSDEDFKNIFGNRMVDEYYAEIIKINKEAVFIYTKGADGVSGFHRDNFIDLPAYKTNVVSTIGAGDAFNAGIVFYLSKLKGKREKIKEMSREEFGKMLESGLLFSSAVCSTMDNYVPSNFSYNR